MKLNIINEKSYSLTAAADDATNYLPGGLADNKTIDDIYDHHVKKEWDVFKKLYFKRSLDEQLKQGIEVEYEHTNDRERSIEIALDHLWEDPYYYTKLATIEEGYPGSGTGGLRTFPKKVNVDKIDINDKNDNEIPDKLDKSNNQLPIPKEPDDKLKPIDKFGPGDR